MLVRMSRAEINDAHRLVRKTGWLAATSPEFQSAILERSIWQRFEPSVTLTHGGDTEGGIVGLVRGAVSIISAIGPSDSPVAYIARAPFWFGERPSLGQRTRTITVITRTVCDVALVPQKSIEMIMAEKPGWWRQLAAMSVEGVLTVTQIATDLLIADSKRRCIAVLLRVADCRKEGNGPCDAGVGQVELAAMANMSRQTIAPILHRLEADGALELGYRTIRVVNPAYLRAIVDV